MTTNLLIYLLFCKENLLGPYCAKHKQGTQAKPCFRKAMVQQRPFFKEASEKECTRMKLHAHDQPGVSSDEISCSQFLCQNRKKNWLFYRMLLFIEKGKKRKSKRTGFWSNVSEPIIAKPSTISDHPVPLFFLSQNLKQNAHDRPVWCIKI